MNGAKRKEVCAEIIELARELSKLSDRKVSALGEELAGRLNDETLIARNFLKSAIKPIQGKTDE